MKKCPECGELMQKKCPECGQEPDYCEECGWEEEEEDDGPSEEDVRPHTRCA
jgi:hypothetical protein